MLRNLSECFGTFQKISDSFDGFPNILLGFGMFGKGSREFQIVSEDFGISWNFFEFFGTFNKISEPFRTLQNISESIRRFCNVLEEILAWCLADPNKSYKSIPLFSGVLLTQ